MSRVEDSELSTLGAKGTTPDRSMNSILSNHKVDGKYVFSRQGNGRYAVSNAEWVADLPKVKAAVSALKAKRQDEQGERDRLEATTRELESARTEIARLQVENTKLRNVKNDLRKKLKEISAICER